MYKSPKCSVCVLTTPPIGDRADEPLGDITLWQIGVSDDFSNLTSSPLTTIRYQGISTVLSVYGSLVAVSIHRRQVDAKYIEIFDWTRSSLSMHHKTVVEPLIDESPPGDVSSDPINAVDASKISSGL